MSPIGQGVLPAGGSVEETVVGLKKTESWPIGRATHPWPPYRLATRVTPLVSVSRTV